jgi:exonuclease SbcC
MKILAIRACNITSLAGEFVIDFTAEPLKSAGLFVITGPTGAGKSSLLDALCLALFGRTPRHSERGKALAEHVLRKGCSNGYAEIDFVNAQQQHFRVRWEARRIFKSEEGKSECTHPHVAFIRLHDGQRLTGKIKEVQALVEQHLNLDFDQFRRAVLLAQGDFAAFLKAKSAERSDLLERITGLEIYSEISKAAHSRHKDEQAKLNTLQEKLGVFVPLEADARQQLENDFNAASTAENTAHTELELCKSVLTWYQQLAQHQDKVAQAEQKLAQARQNQENATPLRTQVEAVSKAQVLRSPWDKVNEAMDAKQRATNELDTMRQGVETAENALHAAQQELDESTHNHATQEAAWHHAQTDLKAARALDVKLDAAKQQADENARTLKAAEKKHTQNKQAHTKLAKHTQTIEKKQHAIQDELAKLAAWNELASQWAYWDKTLQACQASQQILTQAQQEFADLDKKQSQLNKQHDKAKAALEKAQANLLATEKNVQTLTAQQYDLAKLDQQRRELEVQRDILEHTEKLQNLQHRLKTAQVDAVTLAEKIRADETQLAALRQIALQNSEPALQLRETLADEQPCPVCGSAHHPWRDKQAESTNHAELQALEKNLAKQSSALAKNEAMQESLQQQVTEAQTILERQTQFVSRQAGQTSFVAPLPELQSALDNNEQQRQAAYAHQDELKQAQAERDTLDKRLQKQRDKLQQAERDLQALAEPRFKAENQRQTAEQQLKNSREEFMSLCPISGDIGDVAFYQTCAGNVERLRSLQDEQQQAELNLREARDKLKESEFEYQQSERALAECRATHEQRQAELKTLQQQRNALFEGRTADAVEAELRKALDDAKSALVQAKEKFHHAQTTRDLARNNQQHAEKALDDTAIALVEAEKRFADKLTQFEFSETQAKDLLTHDEDWLATQQQVLQEIDNSVLRGKESLRVQQQNLDAHQKTKPDTAVADLEQADQQRLAAEERLTTARKQANDLAHELKKDDERRAQAKEMQRELEEKQQQARVWAELNELIGAHDGKKFRVFAQSLTLDALVAYTNQHLRELARRYLLRREGDLDLLVIDRDMGDEVRSINSLSGGETFLVSLALALGLASLSNERRAPVESLFIDEGFGSLDPDTLDIAIAGLDALQAQGCQVGIISHVPGLAERIGVQIQVEKRGAGGSRVVVR